MKTILLTITMLFSSLIWQAAQSKQSPTEIFKQAQQAFDERRYAQAASLAQQARESNPQFIAAWKLRGLALQLTGQLALAEAEFAAAVKIFPRDGELLFFLARAQYLQGQLKKSVNAAEQALQKNKDFSDAHTQLALALDAQQETQKALSHYQTAIALNQKQGRKITLPLLYVSQLLQRLARYDEAAEYLSQAIALSPQESSLYFSRGRIWEQAGKKEAAEKDFQHSILLVKNDQAIAALERLRGTMPTPKITRALDKLSPISFRNLAASAKLNFTLRNGATPQKFQIETMTGGVGVIDYDGDDWEDIYFVNGAALPEMEKSSPDFWNRLFRNNHDGTFSDVTEKAGVKGEGYGMGIAVADYDNDGDQDLFIAGVDRNLLYRNDGNGKFTDATKPANLLGVDAQRGKMWSVAAAWLDYDNDGNLDLFVVNYCKWYPGIDPYCGAQKEGYRTYCNPQFYQGLPNQLFHNNGDGTFTDVSNATGIAAHIGKGMGVSLADYNDDGLADIFVANDTLPNFLFKNIGGKNFEEVALSAGVAVNDNGKPVSSMGTDFRDYDNDGLPDVIVSALEGETYPLWRNLGKGFFADVTWQSEAGRSLVKRSGWGLGLFDLNNDGWKDLFTVNAHVNDNQELYNEQTYRQSNSILANLGVGKFADVSSNLGADWQRKAAHRGCAFADFDHDGKIDVIATALNEPAEFWRNESSNNHNWLALKLIGARTNRDGIGAKIKVVLANGETLWNHAVTSVGYASASSRLVHFGLGETPQIKFLEILWPDNSRQHLENITPNRILTIKQAVQ